MDRRRAPSVASLVRSESPTVIGGVLTMMSPVRVPSKSDGGGFGTVIVVVVAIIVVLLLIRSGGGRKEQAPGQTETPKPETSSWSTTTSMRAAHGFPPSPMTLLVG
jgi:hypothetical protein